MKLSLITATYNNQETILRCLESVATQSYKDFEHIIIDGESHDDTLHLIMENIGENCRLISEPDGGLYDALNKGIKMSRGEVIGFLHADDYFAYPEALGDVMQLIESKKVEGVYGDLRYVTSNGKIIRSWKAGEYKRKDLMQGWMPPHPTMFLKREVYDKNGLFNTSYKISADYDFILRMLYTEEFKLAYLQKVMLEMQTGGISNRSLSNIVRKSGEDLRAIRENGLPNPFLILLQKNFSKLHQLFRS